MKPLRSPVIPECTLVAPDGAEAPSVLGPRSVELTVDCGPAAEGTHLSAALESRYGPGPYTVAGRPLLSLTPGTEPLVTGCVILGPSLGNTLGSGRSGEPAAHLELVVLSGPDAGAALPLRRGEHHLGRGAPALGLTDPSLSRDHAVLSVSPEAIRWTDRGSLHGTIVDGVDLRGTSAVSTESTIRCGATEFVLRPTALWETDLSSLGAPPGTPHEITAPQKEHGRAMTLLLAAGPLLGGMALAWSSGTWQFALLSLLSSAPFVFPAIAGTRASRTFQVRLEEAMAEDRERLETGFPPLGILLLAQAASTATHCGSPPAGPGRTLPEGGEPASDDGLWLRLGTGEAPANIVCHAETPLIARAIRTSDAGSPRRSRDRTEAFRAGDQETRGRWREARFRSHSRLRARLHGGYPGSRTMRDLTGAVPGFPPLLHHDAPILVRVDPGLKVVAESPEYKEFVCGLLVHLLRRPGGRRPSVILVDPDRVMPASLRFLPGIRWVKSWAEAFSQGTTPLHTLSQHPAASAPARLVVVGAPAVPAPGGPREWSAQGSLTVLFQESPGAGASVHRGPHGLSVVRIDRTLGTVLPGHTNPPAGRPRATTKLPARTFIPDLVSPEVLDRFCRRFRDLHPFVTGSGFSEKRTAIPDTVPLGGLSPTSTPAILEAWHSMCAAGAFTFPLGVGQEGPAMLDLVHDGPHFLVAGTTGAGKSELLRTMVLSAASHLAPSELGFVLVDFKGGAAFDGLGGLPHVHGLVTDLGPAELDRALASLRAEILHREQRFRELRVADWAGYRKVRRPHESPLPRVCLIIDEFRMMMDHAPDSLRELIRLASIGRSLGLHLVLATQRPQGAVSADIRANLGTSIALRVQSELDSLDVIGTSQAAGIPLELPGRAVLAKGATRTLIQVADASSTPLVADDDVRVSVWGDQEPSNETAFREADDPGTHLTSWCNEVSSAWEAWIAEHDGGAPRDGRPGHALGMEPGVGPRPRRVLAPPLPRRFDPARLPDFAPVQADDDPPLALVDRPEHQRLDVLRWARGESVAVLGAPRDRNALASALFATAADSRAPLFVAITVQATWPGTDPPPHGRVNSSVAPATGRLSSASPPETAPGPRIIPAQNTADIARLFCELREGRQDPDREVFLYIESWESTLAAIRSSEHYGLEGELLDLLRSDGVGGVRVLVGGNEGLASSRAVGTVCHSIYLSSARAEEDLRLSAALARLEPSSSRVLLRSSRFGGGLQVAEPVSARASTPEAWRPAPNAEAQRLRSRTTRSEGGRSEGGASADAASPDSQWNYFG
ncbi:S-DNA-T family DNA segregation ATPase FtsK/SpoIIIE [Arthrobacter woluwensis]|uniref:FtsK/SpoIIIE domain-containing protein n=1 Tax=Arthrobacter woluwensis TaxID=156980 RepID=UPI00277F9964|nr:FtsK/SpoIIIE domain-containing protein [Arthrobacter woluwensis]MDQ0709388.1 S-DNA-T family DNA segregation ATPase FtsK/SpoIIIE [Arthrobacter woluwensis]